MNEFNIIQSICIFALPIIFAVTVHEASHGYIANYYGDKTAKMLGRLTLNPIPHIDPLGTVIIPLALISIGTPFLFGWAKPVPVNERNLKNPRKDLALIAIAGPLSNLVMALFWASMCKLAVYVPINWINLPLYLMGMAGIQINLILMLLNLIPLPPLDGSKVLNKFLKGNAARMYDQIEPYGFFILLFLLISGALNYILLPLFKGSIYLIRFTFGL
jgi:Zn-dependent protease